MVLFQKTDTPWKPSYFTPYSFVHFLVGAWMYTVLRLFFPDSNSIKLLLIWMAIHTIYEYKDACKVGTYNSKQNSVGDTIAAVLGFVIMAMLFRKVNLKMVGLSTAAILLSVLFIPEGAS